MPGDRERPHHLEPHFRAFAEYWSFEPRLCRPYRAQTNGKVESGVKYFKGNFLPGREFVDEVHLHEQLAEWMTTIADVRLHGTTHERPRDRFAQEQPTLMPTTGHALEGGEEALTEGVDAPIDVKPLAARRPHRSGAASRPVG